MEISLLTSYPDVTGLIITDSNMNNIIFPKDKTELLLPLYVITNSLLMNYYVWTVIFGRSIRIARHFDSPYVRNFPIRVPKGKTKETMSILAKYLLFSTQYSHLERSKDQLKEEVNLFDRLSRSLVYELYFSEKFQKDGFQVNLADSLVDLLSDISFKDWMELYLKGIKLEERKKKEEENLKTIRATYQRIEKRGIINEKIAKVNSHPWVKEIEKVLKEHPQGPI